ncbi:MAG: hypothetical protein HYV26_08435 [Candidatus Hydrogenedentes bacterium]|nr:hypothetical protein [Candidatus Hydrogenedentota bacterium]
MTQLLEEAIERIRTLAPEDQDAIAARLLAELADDQAWEASFRATTDAQWADVAARVRADIAAGRTTPLDEFLAEA